MPIPIYNILVASSLTFASYVFWRSSVPPTPPASKTETRRQLPWIRLYAVINTLFASTFIALTAFRALASGFLTDPVILKDICPPRILRSPLYLSPAAWIGYFLLFLGGYIRIASQRALGQYFTWEVSIKKDHKLCTTGPYGVIRHPGYLGIWTVRVAINIIQSSQGSILHECLYQHYALPVKFFIRSNYLITLMVVLWTAPRFKLEDDLLRNEFGQEWKRWEKQTPYRILPFIY